MPTLRDVATAAGVSIGTASNAFNRPDLISDELRERVPGEAKRIGYAGPDPAARRLRTGRSGALGLIFTAAEHLVVLGHERVGVVAFPEFADAEQHCHSTPRGSAWPVIATGSARGSTRRSRPQHPATTPRSAAA